MADPPQSQSAALHVPGHWPVGLFFFASGSVGFGFFNVVLCSEVVLLALKPSPIAAAHADSYS